MHREEKTLKMFDWERQIEVTVFEDFFELSWYENPGADHSQKTTQIFREPIGAMEKIIKQIGVIRDVR